MSNSMIVHDNKLTSFARIHASEGPVKKCMERFSHSRKAVLVRSAMVNTIHG